MELSCSGTSWEVKVFKQNFGPFSDFVLTMGDELLLEAEVLRIWQKL